MNFNIINVYSENPSDYTIFTTKLYNIQSTFLYTNIYFKKCYYYTKPNFNFHIYIYIENKSFNQKIFKIILFFNRFSIYQKYSIPTLFSFNHSDIFENK